MSASASFEYIFLLDDDPISVFLTQLLLQEANMAGGVIWLPTAKDAFDSIQTYLLDGQTAGKQKPNLLLMEINLPDLEEYRFIDQLQKFRQDDPALQVAILSTSTYLPKAWKMDTLGIRYVFSKPLTQEKLLSLFIEVDGLSIQ